MAREVRVILLDDLINDDATEADETVVFGLDGKTYEIDLTNDNAHVLRARLKEFIQAGRQISGGSKRGRRPITEPARESAATNRHQNGTDPAAVRAWAKENGLKAPERGRLPKAFGEAFRAAKFHNYGPLNELRQDPRYGTAVVVGGAQPMQRPRQRRPLGLPATDPVPEPVGEGGEKLEDLDEGAAREHYKPLSVRSERAASDAYWKQRTTGGMKIEDMTLVERMAKLTDSNATILGKLAGHINLDRGGRVSGLKTSATKLEDLEMIQVDADSPHGWSVTTFGEYAVKMHGMGE
ncbi:hypothetical protein DMB38_20595 [Streptomyces sp. WAC 06738]|nr:hypothetical protein DMB38_20595 [Streptomyces sp. WAC 06738]